MPRPNRAKVLATAVLVGLAILAVRYFALGDADPFRNGRPVYIVGAAFVAGLQLAVMSRRPITAAVGIFVGLALWPWLFAGPLEYPAAAAIGLVLHGLLPALGGAVSGELIAWKRAAAEKSTSANGTPGHEPITSA